MALLPAKASHLQPHLEANVGIKRLLLFAGLALLFAAPNASAQRRITGHIVATTGEPIGSAHVQAQGTTFTALSNEDGSFEMRVPDGSQVLQVRRLGYKRADYVLNATATDVKIEMTKDVLELERMVVTGTTTSISSVNSANAITTVSGDEVNNMPAPTIENALQGRIPGAVITTNSGAPGGGAQVQLRGVTSINGSSTPLYVVDGVLVSNASVETGLNSITNAGGGIASSQDQMANRIADIDPEEIESIEVLKGASAGAIYGSKASNGVIIITTKRGTSGKPKVAMTAQYGQASISHELGLRCFTSAASALNWWQTVMGGTTLPYAWNPTCNNFENQMYSGNGPSYQTDLNVTGGTPQTSYYLGGGFKRDNAIQLGSYFQRQSITANLNQLIGDHLTVRFNNNFVHTLNDRGISGNDNSPVVSPGDIFSTTPTWIPLASKPYISNPFVSDNANPWQDAAGLPLHRQHQRDAVGVLLAAAVARFHLHRRNRRIVGQLASVRTSRQLCGSRERTAGSRRHEQDEHREREPEPFGTAQVHLRAVHGDHVVRHASGTPDVGPAPESGQAAAAGYHRCELRRQPVALRRAVPDP
jgi:TonB-dependent SusC/RagA subfamily outer membrane receptor